jgi:predicted nuclease of predicted toxin-antitoxin system
MSELRFLADESRDFAVARALRSNGYNVLVVSEYMQRSVDRDLIEKVFQEDRILLTEDKDFGWLVFASHSASAGIILIRFPGNKPSTLVESVVQLVQQHETELKDSFVVIQPDQIRFSRKK